MWNLNKYSLGKREEGMVITVLLKLTYGILALLQRAPTLKMDEKSFIRADVRGKDKGVSREMAKFEGEGKRGCALVFAPLRLF